MPRLDQIGHHVEASPTCQLILSILVIVSLLFVSYLNMVSVQVSSCAYLIAFSCCVLLFID